MVRMLTRRFTGLCSGKGPMRGVKRLTWAASAVLLACTGCSSTDDQPAERPTTPTASASASKATLSVKNAEPSYLGEYTSKERRAYGDAVAARSRFASRQTAFYSRGKATPQAKSYYRQYTASWRSYWARLRQFDDQGIKVLGRSKVIRVRPTDIALRGGSGSISLEICGDGDNVDVLQRGRPIIQPPRGPSIVRVAMVKLEGEDWWRVLYERPAERKC